MTGFETRLKSAAAVREEGSGRLLDQRSLQHEVFSFSGVCKVNRQLNEIAKCYNT